MRFPSWFALALLCSCGSSSSTPDASAVPVPEDAPGSQPTPDAPRQPQLAYVSGYGSGIFRFQIGDDGGLTLAAATPAFAAGPSFLAITPGFLYGVAENNDMVGAYSIAPGNGDLTFINRVSSGGGGPVHITVERGRRYALIANYGDGSVATLPIRADGGLGAPHTYAVGQNAHQIVLDASNRYAFVPCLGSSYVAQFLFDAATGELTPNAVPHLATAAGAGPRHLAFAPDGVHAYLVNELDSTISTLVLDAATGKLSTLQTTSTRAAGASGANSGAEVAVHPAGTFVYASNRGDNTIAVFAVGGGARLTQVGQAPTLGMKPRYFTLDPSGTRLYVANQDSSNVVSFAVDRQTGIPSPIATPVSSTQPTFIGIALP